MFKKNGVRLGTDDLNTDIKISLVDRLGNSRRNIRLRLLFKGLVEIIGHRINMSNFTVTTEGRL